MGFVAELKFSFRRLRERPGDTGLAIVGLRIGSGLADLAVDNFIEMRDKTASCALIRHWMLDVER